jgi:aspartate kinase
LTPQKNPQQILVMKFGGTSVGDGAAIRQVVEIIRQEARTGRRLVVVASAMSGVTNLLVEAARHASQGDLQIAHQGAITLRDKHFGAARELLDDPGYAMQLQAEIEPLITAFVERCQAIRLLGEVTPRVMDSVSSLGERMSVRLLAGALKSAGLPARWVDASEVIVTDSEYQAAHPDMAATGLQAEKILKPVLDAGKIPVVTGFLAADPAGNTTTLGRGGSDYSAAILAVALDAADLWIWTDVDGVMTADPRIVSGTRSIPSLTFYEVGELAYFGAKVLHPKSIRPVVEAGIGLRVCNTFNPSHPGTRIYIKTNGDDGGPVLKAVAAVRSQRMIAVEGRGMLGVPGVAARAFQAVAGTRTSVSLITQASSEQSICFTVPSERAEAVRQALEVAFELEIRRRDIDRITAGPEAVVVTVVGAGMRETPGIAGAVFSALGSDGINVIAIAQGSSDASISLVVRTEEAEDAIRALHRLIINGYSFEKISAGTAVQTGGRNGA